MKRGKRLLTLLLVLLVILGATYGVTLLDPETETEEISYETVFTVDPEEVTAISWDYSEPVSFTRSDGAWVYDEDPAFPLDETYISTMLDTVKEITSSKTIEAVEDWDQYTLEEPICQITVTVGDTTHTLKIGAETALGGGRYLSIGDGNAYLADADILDPFCYRLYDVLAFESIPEMDTVTALEVDSKSSFRIDLLENSGLAYTDEYVWFTGETALDTELTEKLVSYATEVTWQECVSYNAEDLSKYGLDDPAATINVHYLSEGDEGSYTLEIGDACDDGYYARLAGSNMVYTISSGIAETLLYTTTEELLPDEVLLMDWEQVKSMDITLDGETYRITRTTQTVTDDEGNETEETVYKLAGETIEAEDILDALDNLDSEGYATSLTPERSLEIQFTFYRDHDTFPEVELAFYQYNSSTCMVTLNGAATVFTSREDVVDLVEIVNSLVL